MAEYLREGGGDLPDVLTLVIVRARRVQVTPSGGALRLAVSGKDLGPDDLARLNGSSWAPVSEAPAEGWTHLAVSGGEFFVVEARWLSGSDPEGVPKM